jgi:hypothetical protein
MASPWSRASRERVFVRSAVRCGECHGSMESQWASSAHARAATSPGYRAMRALAGATAPDCARCHEPLAAYVQADDPALAAAAAEGVTCDVCHTIAEVELGQGSASFTMRVDSRAKYGPLCDAEDHYFHTMACSELHQTAELCGACHWLVLSAGRDEPLPVYTTYAEWKQGPYAARGVTCQGCHMPGRRGEVAVGAGERQVVSEHGFLDRDLRGRAAVLALRIEPDASGAVRIEYEIHNSGAGHSIPTGSPARRLVLRVRATDASGRVTGQVAASFGRVLVDAAGTIVPFVRAVRVAQDSRIAAGERRVGHLVLDRAQAPGPGALDIELVWQAFAPEIAAALGLSESAEEILLHTRRALAAPGARRVESVMVRP